MAGLDQELDALAEKACAGCGSRPRTWAPSCAATARRSEGQPGRLQEVEERLDIYDRLERKHGGSVAAVLQHAERCRAERDRLLNAEVATARAEAELAEVEARRDELAAGLSAARADAAPRLAAAVEAELAALALADASFSIELQQRDEVGPSGAERVEMTLAPNPGVPAAPLGRRRPAASCRA